MPDTLLQPDRGQAARTIDLIAPDAYDAWLAGQPQRVRTALAAVVCIAMFPPRDIPLRATPRLLFRSLLTTISFVFIILGVQQGSPVVVQTLVATKAARVADIRERMEADVEEVGKKAREAKKAAQALLKSMQSNRSVSGRHQQLVDMLKKGATVEQMMKSATSSRRGNAAATRATPAPCGASVPSWGHWSGAS